MNGSVTQMTLEAMKQARMNAALKDWLKAHQPDSVLSSS
jgi:hypothetical protein